jgi:amidophosphoribosyltransferase
VDFPTKKELLANNRTMKDIEEFLEVDSIGYLPLEKMLDCAKLPNDHYCSACWSGKYPIPVDFAINKFAMEHYQMNIFDRMNDDV